MKVLDPQSALLTTAEVHHFLSANPPRRAEKRIGSYQAVNLQNYNQVRQDFDHYVRTTTPHILKYPAPEKWISELASRLRNYDLTRTEALTLINLGIGLNRGQNSDVVPSIGETMEGVVNGEGETSARAAEAQAEGEETDAAAQEQADEAEMEAESEPDDRQLMALVVEELEERFPGEEGEEKIRQILQLMRDSIQGTNGQEASG